MNIRELIDRFADQPLVESASLITLIGDANEARVQISRWVRSGDLVQLRRGFYLLAPRYRRREPNLVFIANTLCSPSYVSLTYALGFYGLIPEAVAAFTSVTTRRPQTIATPVGRFDYRHIATQLLWGYETKEPLGATPMQIATPEKALLDLAYLTPGTIDEQFYASLRLQNVELLDRAKLLQFAQRFGGAKMLRAAEACTRYADALSAHREVV